MLEELSKCEIVCSECHYERHGGRSKHGSYNRYDKYGCRCDDCKAAKNERYRKYKEKKANLEK